MHPLQIADVEGHLVEQAAIPNLASAWCSRPCRVDEEGDFPAAVTYVRPLSPECAALGDEEMRRANLIISGLKTILGQRCAKDYVPQLCITETSSRTSFAITICVVTKSPEFNVECLVAARPESGDHRIEDLNAPVRLNLFEAAGECWSLYDLVVAVAELGPGPWEYQYVRLAADSRRGEMAIASLGDPINLEQLAEQHREAAEMRRALALLRNSLLPWRQQAKKRVKRVKVKAKAKDKDDKEVELEDVVSRSILVGRLAGVQGWERYSIGIGGGMRWICVFVFVGAVWGSVR